MGTIIKLPPFVAAFFATPFLVMVKLSPRMFKRELIFVVVVEDGVSIIENINLILAACLLSCCSFIRSTKLGNKIIDLVLTMLAVGCFSLFTACNLRTGCIVCCDSTPECTRTLLIAY